MTEELCKMMLHKMPTELRHRLRMISARIQKPMSQIIIDLVTDFIEAERRKEQE